MMNARTLVFLFLTSAALCGAEPGWKKGLSSPKLGNHPRLPAGTMEFQVSWKDLINSGSLNFEFHPKGIKKNNTYVVRSEAVSEGAAAAFFPYKGYSWAELDPASLRPRLFHASEKSKGEKITTTSRYFSNRVECKESTIPKGKKSPDINQHVFKHSQVFDIGSALLYIRSQELKQGDQIKLLIHPFSSPYLMTVKVLGREKHMDQKAIRLSVSMQKINRKTLKLKNYKKLKAPATLWLSDNDLRVPIELRAKVFIGDIRATLTRFKKS